ncbi:uncharacterized protein LOC144435900 [Glandiceps talaboti]
MSLGLISCFLILNILQCVQAGDTDAVFSRLIWIIPVIVVLLLLIAVSCLRFYWYHRFYPLQDPVLLPEISSPPSSSDQNSHSNSYFRVGGMPSLDLKDNETRLEESMEYHKELTLGSLYPMWNQSSLQASIQAASNQTPMAPPPLYTPQADVVPS